MTEIVIEPVIEIRELPPQAGRPCHPFKDAPIIFHSRGSSSDGKWIRQRFRVIPDCDNHLKHHAAEQYERIYGKHGRKAANEWLDAVARKYKKAP